MTQESTITKTKIITLYMDYVLANSENPKSVYAFAKTNNFEETDFYKFFASFEALEKNIFAVFFENTIAALNQSENYINFESRNKLLSFYFTFFENLTANRSYVVYALNNKKNKLKSLQTLSSLKHHFARYIEHLEIDIIELNEDKIEKFQKKALSESAWLQLVLTIKFWIEDTSPSFEKTDIFIEKSVNTSFNIIETAPIKSVIDLGKFLFKEKFKMN